MSHFKGLHHISVLAGDPKENFDFYVKKLGLRMVKKSVNQDDPGTYHLFYGNEAATPGSSITFFPWPRAHKGSPRVRHHHYSSHAERFGSSGHRESEENSLS